MRLRILIVDDHAAAREGLKQLAVGAGIEVGGTFANGSELLSSLRTSDVDAIVADVRMPVVEGLSLLAEIRESYPELPVVMFSAFENPTYVARCVAWGAHDYLLKSDDRATIVEAIRSAVAGEMPAENGLYARIRRLMQSGNLPTALRQESLLTAREAQVFKHVGLGLSNREIAQSLEISIETVKEHVQNILRKIDAGDRTEAGVRAVRMGLIDY